MKVLVTGAEGFLGANLCARLAERKDLAVLRFGRRQSLDELRAWAAEADVIFHLAGVNRPQDPAEFAAGNTDLTVALAEAVAASGRKPALVFSSSIQAELDNPYGRSKLGAEEALRALAVEHGVQVRIFRLANVFGKWCRPNYNSAVATFCHNIARKEPIRVDDPAVMLTLVYVDDVVDAFLSVLDGTDEGTVDAEVKTRYQATLGEIVTLINGFAEGREQMLIDKVGTGFVRALYATFVSYLPPEVFSYRVPQHGDPRGVFVEMLKTPESGQFSYFTAHPGITRGGHYHHTKTEKFLVIKGRARFGFRHIVTNAYRVLFTSGDQPEVVDTVPGWTHDITNVGDEEMVVMLWANEIFDRQRPDTYSRLVDHE